MTQSRRKAIGTAATVIWLIIYSLTVMAFGGEFIVGNGVLGELAFYIMGGMGWIPVAMLIIRWMSRPDEAA